MELKTFLSFKMRSHVVGGGAQYIYCGLMKDALVTSQCHGGCAGEDSAKDKWFRVGFSFLDTFL